MIILEIGHQAKGQIYLDVFQIIFQLPILLLKI